MLETILIAETTSPAWLVSKACSRSKGFESSRRALAMRL